jgi:high-affinity iron transporter
MSCSVRRGAFVGLFLSILIGIFGTVTPAVAQSDSPLLAASSIRNTLFSAQSALLSNDTTGAVSQVGTATTRYQQILRPAILKAAPEVASNLDDAFNTALKAAQSADSLGLAAARSRVWTELVQASFRVVMQALQNSDKATAQDWLQLRDFRTPTKFSRPGADSTLAMKALATGQGNYPAAIQAVRADLLDTYQGKLNEALVNADTAQQQGFDAKAVEQSALAAGYFDLVTDASLSSVYVTLHGADGLKTSQGEFTRLVQASLSHDAPSFQSVRGQIDAALKGFRAAPLSETEQARRANQLAQFVSLVSVEYARGVADGKVIRDIEIQEALTFREGANAAYTDLQTVLEARDPVATAKVGTLLTTLKTQITSTVDPAVLGGTVSDIGKLLTALYPASWQTLNTGSDFDVIASVLDQIQPAVQQGAYAQAETARLQAYAILDSGIEQKLRGFAPDLALRVESLFWQGDGQHAGLAVLLTSNAPADQVKAELTELRAALTDAQTFLDSSKTAPGAVIGNAAVIVFREGLEAVLILASLVASMRSEDARTFRRAILTGGALALFVSAVTWWIANSLLMSMIQYGEKLSVVVGLIAIAVLLLITNWFFHKTYWTNWMAQFHKQKGRILGSTFVIGPSLGLVILGFTSIYREGFETVLFSQSLVLDAGLLVVLQGVILGLLGTAVVGLIVFGLQVRLPAKRMFVVTGILIGVVLLTMVGNTIHAMQSVGWLPISPIVGVYVPYWMGQWFGLFTTWQGVFFQLVAAAFVIGSYFLAEYMGHQKRGTPAKNEEGGEVLRDSPASAVPGDR